MSASGGLPLPNYRGLIYQTLKVAATNNEEDTMAIKHSKVSTIPDGPNANLIRPSDWNAAHTLENATVQSAHLDTGTGAGQINQDGIPDGPNYKRIQVGPDANKPAPGTADRYYLATDTKKLYRDTGTAWEIALSLNHGDLTGISATQHHSNANDPSTDEKAALAGKTGTPSATNKYETEAGRGVANGLATLDPGALIPLAQIPATLTGKSAEAIVQDEGIQVGQRPKINFTGAGVAVTDDPSNDRVNVSIPGGGGGGTETRDFHYYKRTGVVNDLWYPSAINSNLAISSGTIYAMYLIVPKAVTLEALRMYVNAIGTATEAHLGVYTDDGNLYPASLVPGSDVTVTGLGTTGIKSVTGLSINLSANSLYWLVMLLNGTATVRALDYQNNISILGSQPGFGLYPYQGWKVAQAYGALPATFPAGGTLDLSIGKTEARFSA